MTSSLGLPRSLRPLAVGTMVEVAPAPFVDDHEMLVAANANEELLHILSQAREKAYLANERQSVHGTKFLDAGHLREFDQALKGWMGKYPTFTRETDPGHLVTCSK